MALSYVFLSLFVLADVLAAPLRYSSKISPMSISLRFAQAITVLHAQNHQDYQRHQLFLPQFHCILPRPAKTTVEVDVLHNNGIDALNVINSGSRNFTTFCLDRTKIAAEGRRSCPVVLTCASAIWRPVSYPKSTESCMCQCHLENGLGA